jgi:hypothetical protein
MLNFLSSFFLGGGGGGFVETDRELDVMIFLRLYCKITKWTNI